MEKKLSKHVYPVNSSGRGSETCLHLEDDLLTAVYPLLEAHPACHMARALLGDFYGDEEFTPDQAVELAVECAHLATQVRGGTKLWLEVIATLAAEAAEHQLGLKAVAD